MELSEYKQKMKELEETLEIAKKNHDIAKKNLAIEYARANDPNKVGDIVTDGTIIIKIEKRITSLNYEKPESVYEGFTLKKDLTPTKVKKEHRIHQRNVTQVLTLISDKK